MQGEGSGEGSGEGKFSTKMSIDIITVSAETYATSLTVCQVAETNDISLLPACQRKMKGPGFCTVPNTALCGRGWDQRDKSRQAR